MPPTGVVDEHVVEVATATRYAGVSRMTQAACSTAVGEHQPCSRWTIFSAGIAAERMSGYFAISPSIATRIALGHRRRRGIGDDRRVLREVGRLVPARDARAVREPLDLARIDGH